MEREQSITHHKSHIKSQAQMQVNQRVSCNKTLHTENLQMQKEKIYTEQENHMLETLLSHIGTYHTKTEDDKRNLISSIEKQQQMISEFRKLHEARHKNSFEIKNQNTELKEKLESTYKMLRELESG